MMNKILLASASPRRHQLLSWAEINFEVIVMDTDESYPSLMDIQSVPEHIAKNKAIAVQQQGYHDRIIIAADTIVVIDQQIIGKPANREAAIHTLQQLSGRRHQVVTGVVIMKQDRILSFSDTTKVAFHSLTLEQIEYYVDHYKPYDKAGAYAIQEWIGVVGISAIEGDFYNVMGLPVSRVVQALQTFIGSNP
jgi:septum formation protein